MQNPYVQVEGGFLAGLSLGIVPFAGVGQQLLDAGEVLPHGTPEARRGLAVGQIVGGLITLVGGLTGEVAGGLATATGIGAAVGVPTLAVSTTLVVGGVGNIAAGIRGLMTTGSGNSGPPATASTAAGVSNPHGKRGGPAHQAKVKEVASDIKSRGLEVRFEHKVSTPGGQKGTRYVDVVGKDTKGNVVEMHQIGRQTKGGQPVSRERKALDDIKGATGTRPDFHPYN
jgi:hypothetical protein